MSGGQTRISCDALAPEADPPLHHTGRPGEVSLPKNTGRSALPDGRRKMPHYGPSAFADAHAFCPCGSAAIGQPTDILRDRRALGARHMMLPDGPAENATTLDISAFPMQKRPRRRCRIAIDRAKVNSTLWAIYR